MTKERNSTFELIRIIAMLIVVYYHTFYYTYGFRPQIDLVGGLEIVSHVGVIMFVILSGYFGIKSTLVGGGKIITKWFFYFVPLIIIKNIYHPSGIHNYNPLFFITDSPYWFMQSYLALYLFAPVINSYLRDATDKGCIYLIIVLLFLSSFWGFVESSYLTEGKNLVNFIMIYVVGNSLFRWKERVAAIRIKYLLLLYLTINLIVFFSYLSGSHEMQDVVVRLAYNYSSPVLLLNAVLLFVMLSRIRLKSKMINYVASSTLAVYLIHVHPAICGSAFKIPLMMIQTEVANTAAVCFLHFVFAFFFFILCVTVDKLLSPVWIMMEAFLQIINIKLSNAK